MISFELLQRQRRS